MSNIGVANLVSGQLYSVVRHVSESEKAGKLTAAFLPIYGPPS
jgi:hypothetical protein